MFTCNLRKQIMHHEKDCSNLTTRLALRNVWGTGQQWPSLLLLLDLAGSCFSASECGRLVQSTPWSGSRCFVDNPRSCSQRPRYPPEPPLDTVCIFYSDSFNDSSFRIRLAIECARIMLAYSLPDFLQTLLLPVLFEVRPTMLSIDGLSKSASLCSLLSLMSRGQPSRTFFESFGTKWSWWKCRFILLKNSGMDHSGYQLSCIHYGRPASSSSFSAALPSTVSSSSLALSSPSSWLSSSSKPP